jgi:hypothetical protein
MSSALAGVVANPQAAAVTVAMISMDFIRRILRRYIPKRRLVYFTQIHSAPRVGFPLTHRNAFAGRSRRQRRLDQQRHARPGVESVVQRFQDEVGDGV